MNRLKFFGHGGVEMVSLGEKMKNRTTTSNFVRCTQFLLMGLLALSVSACFEEEKIGISYVGVNYTDEPIVSILINGEGGLLHVTAHNEGGEMCCVVMPRKWSPGLNATIKWQEGGTYKRDAQGNVVSVDGVPVVIAGQWKSKTVEVPKYDNVQLEGRVYIHFFPNDDVKVTVNKFGPGHISHPYPSPKQASAH